MKITMRMFQRKNGYFYYEFERDKPRSLYTKDRREATGLYNILKREYLARRLIQLDSGKKTTLKEFKNKFFKEHTDISDKTQAAYELAIKLLIDTVGESTLLSRINKNEIGEFKRQCLMRGVKKVSVNTYLRHIRGILNKAHEWGDIKQKVKVEMYRLPKRHPRILLDDERKRILEYAKKNDFEMYRIIEFALWTGARRAEIANLKWQDMRGDMCRLIGKGDKERTIPLLPETLNVISNTKDIGYVFIHWNDLSKYTKAFKKIARACGIEDIHLHHLRHTAGTQMLKSGIPLEVVQEMLGHEDISTTQIYAKVVQDLLKKQMQKLKYETV